MRSATDRRTFLGVWLLLFAIFVGSQAGFYFHQPQAELGDLAANALQIRNAKSFAELYGNYSRWSFHHPGPAFFYACAFGEWLLFDLTRLVPSPHNAHALVGLLIQTFFFAWALAIVQRWIGHVLLVPLILLLAGLHFTAVNWYLPDSAFRSIWTAHILLFPFLCFLISCASIASGHGKDLIAAVTAGSLLVHVHVAQPLFVVTLFATAYLALILGQTGPRKVSKVIRSFGREHLIASSIIVLFLVPIVLDAMQGAASNLSLILRHFETHSGDRKSAGSSLLYLASFLCYLPHPETSVDPVTTSSWKFLSQRWYFLAAWAAVFGSAIAFSFRSRTNNPSRKTFVRALWATLSMGLLLTFAWGMMQNGPLYNFNSYFNFGLLFLGPILFVIGICDRLRTSQPMVTAVLYLAVIPPFVVCAASAVFHREPPDLSLFPRVEQAAKSGGPSTKLLLFEPDDWPHVVGVALALQRFGYDFAVTEEWGFMFGKRHVVDPGLALRKKEVAFWKVLRESADLESFVLYPGRFMAMSPPAVDPRGTEITFASPNPSARAYTVVGWNLSEEGFSWSHAKTALLYFRPGRSDSDVEITLDVFPAIYPTLAAQRMTISFNGEPAHRFELSAPEKITVRIPAEVWNREKAATISFEFPDAASPKAMGVSADSRSLGYAFKTVAFRAMPNP